MKWRRISAGEYESEDKRFEICKSYDVIFGNHWILRDNKETDYYAKQIAHEYTLKEAKAKAEAIVKQESE